MRHQKGAPTKLIGRAVASAASNAIVVRQHPGLHVPLRAHTDADTVDACSEMFKFCKLCDEKYLQARKIQCLFDVDGGPIPRAALGIVCEIIETLLADIAQNGVCHSGRASLTVTLKCQQGVWILALTERRIAALRQTATARRLSLIRGSAQRLGAACRIHETSEGFITALMFDGTAAWTGWSSKAPSSTIH